MVIRVALAASILAACGFDADYGGTGYQCRDECPAGQSCVDGECRAGTDATDAAAGTPDAAGASYAAEVLADDPVLYLRLDETDGFVATDSSGFERDGTYQVGTTHDADGKIGGAVHCDGVSGRVTVPDDEAMRLNGDWTIELWVKLDDDVNDFPGVVAKGGADESDTGFIVYYIGDSRVLTLKRAGHDGIATMNEPLSTAGFRHYALVYDQSEAQATWYVDGIETDVFEGEDWPDNANSTQLSFGRGDEYGKQWLDEIALYEQPLTAERVAAHFAAAPSD